MGYELIIDVLLAILMAGVIFSAYVLNQRIIIMRQGQLEMKELVAKLDAVTKSALTSIEELKKVGNKSQKDFLSSINKAQGLADELSVITQAGDNLADRLDKKLSGAADERKKSANLNEISEIKAEDEKSLDELGEEQKTVLEALKLAR